MLKAFESKTGDTLGARMYSALYRKYGKKLGNNLKNYVVEEELHSKPFSPKIDEYAWSEVCTLVSEFFSLCKN